MVFPTISLTHAGIKGFIFKVIFAVFKISWLSRIKQDIDVELLG